MARVMGNAALNRAYTLMNATYWASNALVVGFASVFLLARGFSNEEIGVILAVANLAAAIGQPMIATFADSSRKVTLTHIVCALTAASALFALLLLIMPQVLLPTAASYLALITVHMVLQPMLVSVGSHFLNAGRPLNYGLARGLGSGAFALAAAGSGFLADACGVNAILCASVVLFAAFFLIAVQLDTKKVAAASLAPKDCSNAALADAGSAAGVEGNGCPQGSPSGFLEFACANKRFMVFLCGLALVATQHNMLNNFMFQVMQPLGGTASDVGLAFGIAGMSEVPVMAGLALLFRFTRTNTLMRISMVAFTVKAIAFLVAPNIGSMLAAQAIQMLTNGLLMCVSVYYVNAVIAEKDQVKGQTMIIFACTVGCVVGSFAGGQLIGAMGVSGMLTCGVAISAVGSAIALCGIGAKGAPGTGSAKV